MAFCSQCGFLLPPDAVSCPRCNSTVTSSWAAAGRNANAPTVISSQFKTEKSEKPSISKPDLVQEPNQSVDYKTEPLQTEQGEYTPISPVTPHDLSAGYDAQPPIALPSPETILQKDRDVPFTHNSSTSMSHGAPAPDNASSTVTTYPSLVPRQKTKNWAMLLITLPILFLVGAATIMLIVVGPDRIIQMVRGGTIAGQTTPVPPISQVPTSVLSTPIAQSPATQAQSVIDRYYTAINSKDYQTAYDLWLNYPKSYQNFANGFTDTSHDDYTFGDIVQLSTDKVQVNITIIATSTSSQQTSYQGYYIVEQQQSGAWKITSAKIHPV
jgi:hypothetical protein